MANLWLFDIDGTLVNINQVHTASYKLDYKDVLERDVSDKLIESTFGMSEIEMHTAVFRDLGIPHDQNVVDKIINGHSANFEKAIRSTKVKPLDGVVDFLTYLMDDKEHLGVYTGNIEGPARLMLDRAGVSKYFTILSFDDGNSKRWQIGQRAIDKAKELGYDFNKVVVIGDTTRDIDAGKLLNAYTVAVATGSDDFKKLDAEKPDLTLRSLKDYRKILEELKC